jgi:hypothetical protein
MRLQRFASSASRETILNDVISEHFSEIVKLGLSVFIKPQMLKT